MLKSSIGKIRISDILILLILGIVTILCIAPILNTIAISFSNKAAVDAKMVYFWPVRFSMASYNRLLGDMQFFVSFGVSVKRVILGGALNLVLTILMAYPLSKGEKVFRSRNIYMWIIIFTMLFSSGLIPWYMLINKLNLIDTIWALVLPGAVPVFYVVLLMNFFRGIPKELEEAGVVDGAGPWYILLKIYLPVSLPALATITLFVVVDHWNSYFDGLILINNPSKLPLQSYIQQLVIQPYNTRRLRLDELKKLAEISNLTLNSAKIVISMIPILAIYPFLQKYFIHGITLGSVKE